MVQSKSYEFLEVFFTAIFLSAGKKTRLNFFCVSDLPNRLGAVYRLLCGANRFSARGIVSNHLYPRTCCVDVNVYLFDDVFLGRDRLSYEYTALVDDGACTRADRRDDDFHRVMDRCALGSAYLGSLVGMGCPAYVRANFAFFVHRLHGTPLIH